MPTEQVVVSSPLIIGCFCFANKGYTFDGPLCIHFFKVLKTSCLSIAFTSCDMDDMLNQVYHTCHANNSDGKINTAFGNTH